MLTRNEQLNARRAEINAAIRTIGSYIYPAGGVCPNRSGALFQAEQVILLAAVKILRRALADPPLNDE